MSPAPDPTAWAVDALSVPWDGILAYAYPHCSLTETPGENKFSIKLLPYSHCPKLASATLVSGPAESVGGQTNLHAGERQTCLSSLGKEVSSTPNLGSTTRMACIVSGLTAAGFSEATASKVVAPQRPSP